jgi:proteasome lid subunit RPN8/RPN11
MLIISPKQIEEIGNHAKQIYPEECCGLLIGTVVGETKIVTEVLQTENNWEADSATFAEMTGSKQNRFSIDPRVLLQTQKDARERHLSIIGIYHSHPDSTAIPSEFDRRIAWSGYSYLIIAVREGQAVEVRSWSLDPQHRFQPEAMAHKIS